MCTLFIVEDNLVDQFILKVNLTKYSIFKNIFYYNNGQPLINYLVDNKDNRSLLPDMIFLDLEMPGFDGWKVLEELQSIYKSLCKEITVYIITTSIASKDKLRVSLYSFVKEFISKPVTKKNFNDIAEEAQLIHEEI